MSKCLAGETSDIFMCHTICASNKITLIITTELMRFILIALLGEDKIVIKTTTMESPTPNTI